jgi:hypothetical protein
MATFSWSRYYIYIASDYLLPEKCYVLCLPRYPFCHFHPRGMALSAPLHLSPDVVWVRVLQIVFGDDIIELELHVSPAFHDSP